MKLALMSFIEHLAFYGHTVLTPEEASVVVDEYLKKIFGGQSFDDFKDQITKKLL